MLNSSAPNFQRLTTGRTPLVRTVDAGIVVVGIDSCIGLYEVW